MKILWLVNIIMPELAEHLGDGTQVFGGWLTGAKESVLNSGNDMVICTVEQSAERVGKYEINGVTYYIVHNDTDSALEKSFSEIFDAEMPDVIHVYGTECSFIWPFLCAADLNKTVLTLQGTLQFTRDVAYAGIPENICRYTAWQKLRRKFSVGDCIELQKRDFTKRAIIEERILKKVRYADGCSDWGIAYIRAMNPECRMFNCGCLLRPNFYDEPTWSFENCEEHSIFALMTRPIKGAHKLIEAMPYVLQQYPDAKLYIGGTSFTYRNYTGFKRKLQDMTPDYHWYVQGLIEKLGLKDRIIFLGYLNAEQMKEQLLNANVFVSPSAQEHLATALGEAMITGTPSISTSIGALCEMINHREDGYLYDFAETHILAQYICDVFNSRELAEKFSVGGRKHANITYNKVENGRKLIEMYETIVKNAEEKADDIKN